MFAQLGLHERLIRVLNEQGFVKPTEVQQAVIPVVLKGQDVRATARTGTGKTAAFILPLLQHLLEQGSTTHATRCLVLAPTRELAQQILAETERFARYTFFKAGLIIGGENFKKQAAMLRRIPDLLVATPGRLLEHLDAGHLPLTDIQVLVLDEADRMLDLGFAEDILRITQRCAARKQTLLLSATTGGRALRDMTSRVLDSPVHLMLNPVYELSKNIQQQIMTADTPAHKEQLLEWLLGHEHYRKAIVFTNTRTTADRLYGRLLAKDYRTFVLHSKKEQQERRQALQRFSQGNANVLFATDVAARGLDIEGVDLVINFDMPRSGDEYVHRIGRTGRGDESGLVVSLIEHHDWNLMSSIQRYLKQTFVKRVLPGLKGSYHGPKKVKASGKSAGRKKKTGNSADKRPCSKLQKPAQPAKSQVFSDDGYAPLRKRP